MDAIINTYILREQAAGLATSSRVDADSGILHGVKILGLESRNTGRTIGLDPGRFGEALDQRYRYSLDALREAAKLYEGQVVRVDHPEFERDADGQRRASDSDRLALDTFGELRRIRVTESGLFGDLHAIRSHPAFAFVFEIAERFPDKLALSHDAGGVPELIDGRIVITKISEVRGVDIIGEKPGTTNGLFESQEPDMIQTTIRKIVEKLGRKRVGRDPFGAMLLEQMDELGAPVAEIPVQVEPEANAQDQIKDAFRKMVMAAFDDDSLDSAATIKKIREILKAQEKLGSAEPAPAIEQEDEDEEENGTNTTETGRHGRRQRESVSAMEERLGSLERHQAVRELVESRGIAWADLPDAKRELVTSQSSVDQARAIVESWSPLDVRGRAARPKIRSLTESVHEPSDYPKEYTEFVRAMK